MIWYAVVGAFGVLSIYFWRRFSADEVEETESKTTRVSQRIPADDKQETEKLVANIDAALNDVASKEAEVAATTTANKSQQSTASAQEKKQSEQLGLAARRAPVASQTVCTEDLSNLTSIPIGEPFQFTVQTRDMDGNKCTSGRAPVQARAEDVEGFMLACDVRDHLDGTYAVSFTPSMSGEHLIHVMLGSKRHIKNSPYRVSVSAPIPHSTSDTSLDAKDDTDINTTASDDEDDERDIATTDEASSSEGESSETIDVQSDMMARALAAHDAQRAAAAAAAAADASQYGDEGWSDELAPPLADSDDDDDAYVVSSHLARFVDGCSASGLALLSMETPPRDLDADSESDEENEDYDIVVLNESARFRVGFAETQGPRPSMEDAMVIYGRFRERDDEDLFGVFDGHGGDDASDLASDFLYEALEQALAEATAPGANPPPGLLTDQCTDPIIHNALKQSFVRTHEEIVSPERGIECGTTAIVAYIKQRRGFVANVGDSRAVLAMSDGRVKRLTRDHKADDELEMVRVRERGGFVARGRVMGMIAIARALGDKGLAPYLGHEPDVFEFDIDGADLLILACDGIWDVLSDAEAVRIARTTRDPRRAAVRMRDQAIDRNSRDNISCLVIQLNSLDVPPPLRGNESNPLLAQHMNTDENADEGDGTTAASDETSTSTAKPARARTDNSEPPRPNF